MKIGKTVEDGKAFRMNEEKEIKTIRYEISKLTQVKGTLVNTEPSRNIFRKAQQSIR